MSSILALFTLGLLLGALLTLSLWSRESLHGPFEGRWNALVSHGKQLWSVVGDPNIRVESRGGLRVMSPLRDGTPSSSYSAESREMRVSGAPAEDNSRRNEQGLGGRGVPTNQVNSSTGAIESLLSGLRTLNGWTATTILKSPMTYPPQTQSGGVHTHQLNSSESPSTTGWTPGHPGQFIKNESKKQQTPTPLREFFTRKTIINSSENLNRVQRPEIKRGREKYEPELGINSIGAGITQTPDEPTQKNAKSLNGVDSRTSLSPVRLLTEPPPWVPYHEQYKFLDGLYIPSLESVSTRRHRVLTNPTTIKSGAKLLTHRTLPDMSQQKGVFEHENLKLHLCNAVFEAYSASFLTTRAHMISVKSESFNLSWVNCEMASFIHMRDSRAFYKNPHGSG